MPTAIIGAGLAGLTAANYAADNGEQVVLVEARSLSNAPRHCRSPS